MTIQRNLACWLLAVILITLVFSITSLASAQPGAPRGAALNLDLEVVVRPGHLEAPVEIAHAGDERLFVIEREGRIRIVRPDGAVQPTPFLDIAERVRLVAGEQGLLGLAFHPNYRQNGAFYVNYSAEPDGATHVSRFSVGADPDVADPDSELLILSLAQPSAMHHAGDLLFGPDGYLYIPLGDGAGGNDRPNRVQNLAFLYGKLLRIDVDAQDGAAPDCGTAGDDPGAYTVPADNPFVDGKGGACDEIWALGLRNPWRASFDRLTGDLYIGDVGESAREEIDVQPADSSGGENYGWPCYEGTQYNDANHMPTCEDPSAYQMPIFEYSHVDGGCSVSGGYVYRGLRFPEMQGRYLLSDFCLPSVWDLENSGGTWQGTRHDNMQGHLGGVATLGEDVYGELYIANMYSGAIFRFIEDTLITDVDAGVHLPAIFK